MYRHVVMFEWNDDAQASVIEEMSKALDALVETIPEVREFRHGPDLGIAEGNFDYVFVSDYASIEDYAIYRDHPEHQRIIAEMIKPYVKARAAVQYDAS